MKRGTPRHPKIHELCERLGELLPRVPKACRHALVIGYLELLWHFTAEFAPQGNIGRFSDRRIEAALGWAGDPGLLIEALVTVGWCDTHSTHRLLVHDWHEHADESVRKRLGRAHQSFHVDSAKVTGKRPDMSGQNPPLSRPPEPGPEPEPEPSKNPAPKTGADVVPFVAKRRQGKRTTEEIRKALGERLLWWDEFWKVFPCHEGMNPCMDAFERRVHDRDLAAEIYRGARAYAAQAATDPTLKLKHGQGWLNDERWRDEFTNRPRESPRRKDFIENITELMAENLAEGRDPFGHAID